MQKFFKRWAFESVRYRRVVLELELTVARRKNTIETIKDVFTAKTERGEW